MPFNVTEKCMLDVQESEWGITIVQGYINKDGEFKPEFCKKKNFQSREMTELRPLSVYLGKTKKTAVAFAKYILEAFGERVPEAGNLVDSRITEDDIPF